MADDGVTSESTTDQTSTDEAETDEAETDEAETDEAETDEAQSAEEPESADDADADQNSAEPEDAKTCDECGSPLTSEIVDFKVTPNSKWADMGGAGEAQYVDVCTNEECPTNQPDKEFEAESGSGH